MRVSKIIFLSLTMIMSIISVYNASEIVEDEWNSVLLQGTGINTSDNLEEQLNIYSNKVSAEPDKTTFSSDMWTSYPDDSTEMRLYNQNEDVVGQWIRFNDISISGYYAPTQPIDIQITITSADPSNNPQKPGDQEITFSTTFGGMSIEGYTRVDFRVDFYEAGTNTPVVLAPIIKFADIDFSQVLGTTSSAEATVQTDSKLEVNQQSGTYFTYEDEATTSQQDKWVLLDFGETSSFNFTWGSNKFNPDATANDGGYTYIDLRLRGAAGKIDTYKVDENGNPLAGAGFTIYDDSGTEILTIYTDDTGYAVSSSLEPGNYTVVETVSPIGYELDDTVYNVTVENRTTPTTINNGEPIVNKKIDGCIELNKVDQDDKPLAGVEFTVYDSSGNQVEKLITDENGYAISNTLPGGQYTITETKALEGYIKNSEEYSVNITKADQLISLNNGEPIINQKMQTPDISNPEVEKPMGSIRIEKINENNDQLSNAEFDIIDSFENVVDHVVTNESGIAETISLPLGKYTVIETKAPEGYVLDTTPHPVELHSDGELVTLEIVNVYNEVETVVPDIDEKQGYIEIVVNGGAGQRYYIYDDQGKLIETINLDENGVGKSGSLDYGDYTLVGPEGNYQFTISRNKLVQVFEFESANSPELNDTNPPAKNENKKQVKSEQVEQTESGLEQDEHALVTTGHSNLYIKLSIFLIIVLSIRYNVRIKYEK